MSEDPVGFLNIDPNRLVAMDEVQRVSELILALKHIVDFDTRPGRFLSIGSANLLKLQAIEDKFAGRTERIELYGFIQGELVEHTEKFIDRLSSGNHLTNHTSELN